MMAVIIIKTEYGVRLLVRLQENLSLGFLIYLSSVTSKSVHCTATRQLEA